MSESDYAAGPRVVPATRLAAPALAGEGMESKGTRSGVVLMAVSLVLWVPLPLVPFLPLAIEERAGLGAAMLLGAEITFWVGAFLAGPEAVKRGKRWVRERVRARWAHSLK